MIHKNVKLLFLVVAFVVPFSNNFSQQQSKPLPVVISCRKSFLGGSYVLQIKNTSASSLKIWIDARGKIATYNIPAGRMKKIGWVQGFRFDANDIYFIGSDGFNTIKQVMPSKELSAIRLGFSNDGALTINLSQSFLQKQLNKYLKLPISQNYPKIIDIELNQRPKIILKNISDKIYVDVVLQTISFSGKVHVPINLVVSFIPSYATGTGAIMASQIKVDDINIGGFPKQWFSQVTDIINKLIPIWFSNIKLFQIDKTTLKYCKFFNVRKIKVKNRRLVIELL